MNQLNARISAKVDVFNPLLELFRARYPPDSISKIEPILKHFQALRNDLINPNILFGDIKLLEASIKKTREYLAMHAAIFRCVDPASFGAKLPWTDSISKVGTWSTDINGEKFSMLFNLGVTHHNLGKLLVETASKYKEAAKQYWTAAAVFTKIRQELMAIRLQDIGTDFSEPNLKLNMYTAKAMAQLCVIESTKADYENTARLFMARICQCAAELFELAYGSAMSSLVTGPLKEFLSEEFRNSLYFFFKLFQGLAAFYAARIYGDEGLVQDVQNSIGTAVGLLKVARAAFAECDKPRKVAPFVKSYYNRYKDFVKTKTEYIEKRNKEIYQEEMPMVLPKIEAVGIPKEVDMEEVFQTEFEGKMVLKLLVPTEILNLEKEYKNSVHKIKCGINAKEEEYKKEEEGFLSDRKLPQWVFEINDQKTNGEFPEQHTRNILKTHSKGGLEGLAKLHRQIKSEVGQWKIFMMHCPKNLEEEEKKYNEYKAKLKEEWTQVPSSDLNKDMKSEVEECLAKIKEGTENHEYYEKLLKSECEEKELLQLISKDIKEMQTEIPVSVVVTRIIAAPLAAQITNLFDVLNENMRRRKAIIKEIDQISEKEDVIKELYAISANPSIKKKIFKELLQKYHAKSEQISECVKERIAIFGEIDNKLFELNKGKQDNSKASERAEYFEKLDKACTLYMKLRTDLKRLLRNYKEYTNNAHTLAGKVYEYARTRANERGQLKLKLSITN